jgi:hypothetical protein
MTMTYTIKLTNGRTVECTDYATEVLGILAEMIGADVEVDDAEQDGGQDEDGGQPMRRLVWTTGEDAENDDGGKAVASVRWTQ